MKQEATMTLHEPYHLAVPAATPTRRIAGQAVRLGNRITAVVKAMQYARMKSVLHQLTDEQLAAIGVRRPDIPAYAYSLIYEP
jgi:uncharacterized protein YjiS (DUF1127 family)